MVHVQSLICNIVFVIFPYLITEVFFPKHSANSKWLLALLSAASIVLCMTFPIISFSGQLLDLRLIPFLLAFLYGGWRIGLLLLILICSYRFMLGGSGAYANLLAFLILLMVLFPANKYYRNGSIKSKVRLVLILTLFHNAIIIIAHMVLNALSMVDLWTLVVQPVFTVFMVFMIETHLANQVIREQMHHSEKLQAISQIAASVSHEIRNPITVVRGFVQIMLQDDLSEKHRSFLKLSMDELDRANKIITDYLAYARPQPDKWESIRLGEEIEHVVSILTPFANLHDVEIETNIQEQGTIWGDPLKLRQALLNFMKNGIEAMTEGGTLTIQLHQMDSELCITIQDTGVGMTSTQIQKLGTPYYSLKAKGTGLGTMVAFRVMDSVNGKVKVQSQVGIGTTLSLSFPLNR